MSDDMAERWARARLGDETIDGEGRRCVAVHIECDGDPREEVLSLLGSEKSKPKRKASK